MEMGINLPIIFVTGYGDIPMSVQAMRRGAEDFLSKPFDDEALFDAIDRAYEREARFRSKEKVRKVVLSKIESLTPREHEICAVHS